MNFLNAVISPITNLVSEMVTDKDEAARLKHAIETMDQVHQHQNNLAQLEVNKAEAQNKSIWVSGWRPGVGWVCCFALAYMTILRDWIVLTMVAFGVEHETIPEIEMVLLGQVLLGMLGLAGARSWEKFKGVARN